MLWVWGLCGAFVYAAPTLVMTLWADLPPGELNISWRLVTRGLANFVIALLTGGIFSEGLSHTVQDFCYRLNSSLRFDLVAISLTIGWASNYLWPRILMHIGVRLEDTVEKVLLKPGNDL
jgi:hypothetical protein